MVGAQAQKIAAILGDAGQTRVDAMGFSGIYGFTENRNWTDSQAQNPIYIYIYIQKLF